MCRPGGEGKGWHGHLPGSEDTLCHTVPLPTLAMGAVAQMRWARGWAGE